MPSKSLVEISNTDIKKFGIELFLNFSLSIKRNERIGITGPSGCGKTTLLEYILNQKINGVSSNGIESTNDINISYVPQNQGLLPWYSLHRNMELHCSDERHIKNILSDLGLSNVSNSFPNELSGGEYQRAILGLAILNNPDLYIADEPLTQLDISSKWNYLEYWSKYISDRNASLLIVSHDIETLIFMCNKILIFPDKPIQSFNSLKIEFPYPRHKGLLKDDGYFSKLKELIEYLN